MLKQPAKKMEDTFLANLEHEGRINPDARSKEEEKETPPVSSAEKEPKDETTSLVEKKGEGETSDSEKSAKPEVFQAFHKHPRWISAQQELKELRDFKERIEPLLSQLDKKPVEREEKQQIPTWFIDLFGENADAWAKYRAYNVEERKQIREEILGEVRREAQTASAEVQKWDKWVSTEFNSLVEDDEISSRAKAIGFDLSKEDQLKSFRNELSKVAVDYQPSDDENNISFRKAFDILELQKLRKQPDKTGQVDRKKEIADKTMDKGKSEADKKNFKTSFDLAGKSFRDLVPEE